jgi:hypothetical protein
MPSVYQPLVCIQDEGVPYENGSEEDMASQG